MPGAQDEPVAVRPIGPSSVVVHNSGPENMGEGSKRHRRSGMAVSGSLHRVHGQRANHLYPEFFKFGIGWE